MAHLDLFVRQPWNRGRIIGPKPPLKPKHVWAIRQQLSSGPTGLTACAAPRWPSSTRRRETRAPASFCWDIASWRARFAISELR